MLFFALHLRNLKSWKRNTLEREPAMQLHQVGGTWPSGATSMFLPPSRAKADSIGINGFVILLVVEIGLLCSTRMSVNSFALGCHSVTGSCTQLIQWAKLSNEFLDLFGTVSTYMMVVFKIINPGATSFYWTARKARPTPLCRHSCEPTMSLVPKNQLVQGNIDGKRLISKRWFICEPNPNACDKDSEQTNGACGSLIWLLWPCTIISPTHVCLEWRVHDAAQILTDSPNSSLCTIWIQIKLPNFMPLGKVGHSAWHENISRDNKSISRQFLFGAPATLP